MEYPISINGIRFNRMIIADSAEDIAGMLAKSELPDDGGIICVFPVEERLFFWMKDIAKDLDIVFINKRNRIVATKKMVAETPRQENETEIDYEKRLKTYSSGCPAIIAIEFKAGTLEKLNLKIGGRFPVDLSRLTARN